MNATSERPELAELLRRARELSWQRHGREVTFYLPGMFTLDGVGGRYPAASITDKTCALSCDHCQGRILASMVQGGDPERLVATCRQLAARGAHGVLLSGGCDPLGRLPWEQFYGAIERIKALGLIVSVHSGLVDLATARRLKAAGVDQALVDVIGDDATFRKVYHVDFGVEVIRRTLGDLAEAGLPLVPHIVCGLDYGRMHGEFRAVEMIAAFAPAVEQLVVVSLMRIPGTRMAESTPPPAEEVAELLATARLTLPDTRISLGCARQRGNARLETLALESGVNRLALPSDEAVAFARELGLSIRYQTTCCSVGTDLSAPDWQ